MQVFLCTFGDFSVAIPMDSISSLILYTGETEHKEAAFYNAENQTVFISLFFLFNLPPEITRHGVVLKNADDNETTETKVIMLCTAVESKINIPDETIYPVPNMLNGTLFSTLFKGIQLTENNPVLILNSEQFIQYAKKKIF